MGIEQWNMNASEINAAEAERQRREAPSLSLADKLGSLAGAALLVALVILALYGAELIRP
jgi:hypothetical protein